MKSTSDYRRKEQWTAKKEEMEVLNIKGLIRK